jgi:putative phosphonate transport system ATP-binding protein
VDKPILTVRNMSKQFGSGCLLCRERQGESAAKTYCQYCGTVYACAQVSFELYPGEVLGLVGESGSGKSTLLRCLYFDEDASSGEAYIRSYRQGESNIFAASAQQKRYLRNHVFGMVYQNPLLGLRMNFSSIGNIAEKLIAAGRRHVREMEARGEDLFQRVSLPLSRVREEPKYFSGGMQQRVQIAKALSNNPSVLLLDEITTGLDLSVQANVLDLIKEIQRATGISMLIVSHDLAVIRMLADRTIVMFNGEIVEAGLTDQVLEDPQHWHTQQLVHSLL